MTRWVVGSILHGGPIELFLVPVMVLRYLVSYSLFSLSLFRCSFFLSFFLSLSFTFSFFLSLGRVCALVHLLTYVSLRMSFNIYSSRCSTNTIYVYSKQRLYCYFIVTNVRVVITTDLGNYSNLKNPV